VRLVIDNFVAAVREQPGGGAMLQIAPIVSGDGPNAGQGIPIVLVLGAENRRALAREIAGDALAVAGRADSAKAAGDA